MTESLNSSFLDDPEFQALLVGCMESLERGETIDRAALAKDFPKFAGEIGQFLDDRKLLEKVASDFGDVDPSRVTISAYEQTMASETGADEFTVGDTVSYIGEYEILEEIARGGMGVVFKARQQKLKRIVALKMILAGRLADSTDVERFQREARAAGKLKHPCIVPVHEIGEHDGHHYFTMDFVEGRSLAEAIREETLAPQAAAKLVQSTAEAVQYAHEQGIVHRDLKPANILLDKNSQPQVTDFGLARILESVNEESRAELTASGQILGTPSYMSPEQASGKQDLVGPASDIYSLGAILYASLTGRAPFVTDSPVDTLLQVIKKEPVSPRDLNPSVPKDLETICLKCLEKEPHKRYGTAALLAEDLARFLQGQTVLARPVGALTKSLRWCKRNRHLAAVSCTTALLLAMLSIGAPLVAWWQASMRQAAESLANRNQALADSNYKLANKERDARERVVAAKAEIVEKLDLAQRLLYAQHMNAAYRDFQSANMVSAWRQLNESAPQLRGWEYEFLKSLFENSLSSLDGHAATIKSLAFSPVTGELFSSCHNGHLACWDLKDNQLRYEVSPLNSTEAVRIQLNEDGSEAACWGGWKDHSVRVLTTDSGEQRLKLVGHKDVVHSVAFSPDNRYIATGSSDYTVMIWDVQDGTLVDVLSDATTEVFSVAFGPNGMLYAATWNAILAWNTENNDLKAKVDVPIQVHAKLAVASNGSFILSNHGGSITVWNAESLKKVRTLASAGDKVFDFALSPNDEIVATCDQNNLGSISLWNVSNGFRFGVVRGHDGVVTSLAFNYDETSIATGGIDGSIKVWQIIQSKNEANWIKHGDRSISAVAFSPDGNWLASGSLDQSVKIWDAKSGQFRTEVKPTFLVGGVAWCADSGRIASVDQNGMLQMWNADSGEELFSHSLQQGSNLPVKLASDSPSELLAVSCEDQVLVFDCSLRESILKLPEFSPRSSCSAVALATHPKHGQFVVCAHSNMVRVWDISTNNLVSEFAKHERPVTCVAVSNDAKMVASGDANGVLKLWNLASANELASTKGHSGALYCIAFTEDGSRVATGSYDRLVKIWDAATGMETLTLPEHEQYVSALAFGPNGHQFVSAGGDGAIIFWNR